MVIGLIWAVCWWKFVKEKPEESTEQENMGKEYVAATSEGKLKFTFYLKQKTVLFTALAFFSYNYISSFS